MTARFLEAAVFDVPPAELSTFAPGPSHWHSAVAAASMPAAGFLGSLGPCARRANIETTIR
jgi:hypothetical protein